MSDGCIFHRFQSWAVLEFDGDYDHDSNCSCSSSSTAAATNVDNDIHNKCRTFFKLD